MTRIKVDESPRFVEQGKRDTVTTRRAKDHTAKERYMASTSFFMTRMLVNAIYRKRKLGRRQSRGRELYNNRSVEVYFNKSL